METWHRNPGASAGSFDAAGSGRVPVDRRAAGGGPPERVDRAGAAERCERLLTGTLRAVRPELAWRHGAQSAGTRLVAPEGDPYGTGLQWYVGRSREIETIVAASRRGVLLGMVEAHWSRCGAVITRRSAGAEPLGLPAEPFGGAAAGSFPGPFTGLAAVTPDGYRLEVGFGLLGDVRLTATSPGVPCSPRAALEQGREQREAAGRAGAEDLAGVSPVRCSFWTSFE